MESSQVFQVLADFGALGLASGAIFWLYIKMSQRMDKLTDSFQEQLRAQSLGHTERETSLRDRYDGVIAQYNTERLEMIEKIVSKLDVVEKELTDIEGNTKLLLEMMADRG